MAPTTLLDLPDELLNDIFSYLDWDRSSSLTPTRPDILSISVTCHRLRLVILPLVFQNVTLRLQWANGTLVEPALIKIRRQLPHVAKYVRCVYIETRFGHPINFAPNMKALGVPQDLRNWIDHPLDISDDTDRLVCLSHQQRLSDTARNLFEDTQQGKLLEELPRSRRRRAQKIFNQLFNKNEESRELVSVTSWRPDMQGRLAGDFRMDEASEVVPSLTSAPQPASFNTKARTLCLQLEAFVLVLACLPPFINAMFFNSTPSHHMNAPENTFALNVAGMVMKVFGDRLQQLAMITHPHEMGHASRRARIPLVPASEHGIIKDETLSQLKTVKTLILADHDSRDKTRFNKAIPQPINWHMLTSSVVHLELWNMANTLPEFSRLIEGFKTLQSLSLNVVSLDQQNRPMGTIDRSSLLTFLIGLRRLMPGLRLRLDNLRWRGIPDRVSQGGIRWLLEEAVPRGCTVGFDRETRLQEDFESFLPLWNAEDSLRGHQALEGRKDRALVDAAMCNRWRTFESSRWRTTWRP